MTQYGYTLLGEGHGPEELVALAQRSETAGFDFVAASDHYHPWVPEQRHSPYVWSVLGAVAATTERVDLMTMVTCPILRYHPAVVAQKAATMAVMSGGRFTLGVGAGERLNEHVVGRGWPPVDVRHEMLAEALEVMRLLWRGGYRSHRGRHFRLEDARVFDLPDSPVPVAVATSGAASVDIAGRLGDGLIAIEPNRRLVEGFRAGGGEDKPAWGQIAVSFADDDQEARRLAHQRFRWGALGWKVMAELPNPVNFDAATAAVTPDALAEVIPCGADPERYVQAVGQFTDAGFDRVALVQVGDDHEGFFRFFTDELRPRLESRQPA